jgi:hypothetical protein
MPVPTVPVIPRDGTITISDATAITPLSVVVLYEDGDFTIGPFRQGNMQTQEFYDRGIEYAVRRTTEAPLDFSFSAHAVDWSDTTRNNVVDAFCKTGGFSAGVSTLGASADAWAVTIVFGADQTTYGATTSGSITLTYCVGEVSFAEGLPGKFTVSGKAHLQGSNGITRA